MSIVSNAERLAVILQERADDDLRAVAAHWTDEEGVQQFEIIYYHDDFDTRVEQIQHDDAAKEIIIDLLSKDEREDAFQLGSLTSTVYLFEEATVVTVYTAPGEGVAFSVEPDAIGVTRSFIEQCREVVVSDP